jgi:hypothetical protein
LKIAAGALTSVALAYLRVVALTVALAAPISAALTACGGGTTAVTTTAPPRTTPKPLPRNAIKVHWKRSALVPAPRAGRVCITTYKTGYFCAAYRFGQIPATALKRKLRTKGFVVITVP